MSVIDARFQFAKKRHVDFRSFAGFQFVKKRHLDFQSFAGFQIVKKRHVDFTKFRKVSICEETSCGTISKMPGFLPFVKMYEKPMVAMIVCNFDNFGHLENVILIFKVSQVLACQFDPPF